MKKKQERSLTKPRNHEEAEIQSLRNALGTTFVTFQDGADLEPTHRQPLFSITRTWNMHRPPTNTQNSQRLN